MSVSERVERTRPARGIAPVAEGRGGAAARAWVGAGLLGVLLLLGACGGGDAGAPQERRSAAAAPEDTLLRLFRNANTTVAFAGDDACFTCHEDIYRGYQEHGMAQSFYALAAENEVEDFSAPPLHHAGSGFYYRAYREGGRFFQEEYRLDAAGRKTHRLVREMKYVVGSGSAARTYLTESNGRLYEMPLTWYTQKRRWDFSPGYDVHNARFDRLVPDRCMACHNSYPESVPFAEGKYADVPHGIGCERCHGPGALHIEARLADPEVQGVDYTIVNPKHLPLDRRLDVCQQCHLHTTASILREGRGPFDFRPGQPLAAHVALYAAEGPSSEREVRVISHADRMKQSPCFIASQETSRPMDCMTCHNPHEGFRTKGPAYFNQSCLECHTPAALVERIEAPEARRIHTAEANCTSCHMPKVEAADAPHASFTDHWIRVVEEVPAPAPLAAHRTPELVPYFEGADAGAEADVYRGMAYVVYGRQEGDEAAMRKGAETLEAALREAPDHGEGQFLLGFTRMSMGELESAIPALEAAVRLNPSVPERLNALAQAYEATGRDPGATARLYQRALALQPALAEVRVNYGRFLEAQGRLDEAVGEYRRAVEEQPWLETAHFNLGTAYLRQGNVEAAEAALRRAVELEPGYVEALGNLGLLYASRGETDRARAVFEQAVEAAPGNPLALGNLGAYYLNEGAMQRAVELLERAVEADPRYVDALVNLSIAYLNLDNPAMAERYARQALQIDPGNARARQVLQAL